MNSETSGGYRVFVEMLVRLLGVLSGVLVCLVSGKIVGKGGEIKYFELFCFRFFGSWEN